jgi:hypothetical protein
MSRPKDLPRLKGKVLARDVGAWGGTSAGAAATSEVWSPVGDPAWELDVELLGVAELARRAFGTPLEAGVFLQLVRGPWTHDRLMLYTEIVWLRHARDAEKLVKTLLGTGWAVLKCASPADADRLCKLCRTDVSKRVRVIRLGG